VLHRRLSRRRLLGGVVAPEQSLRQHIVVKRT
jgi:hypothetical protein